MTIINKLVTYLSEKFSQEQTFKTDNGWSAMANYTQYLLIFLSFTWCAVAMFSSVTTFTFTDKTELRHEQ